MYHVFFYMMILGFGGCSLYATEPKMKAIGILLTAVNMIMFWKGGK